MKSVLRMFDSAGKSRCKWVKVPQKAFQLYTPFSGGLIRRAAVSVAEFERVISFDMGGTSTDVALSIGEARLSSEGEIAGFQLKSGYLGPFSVKSEKSETGDL